MDPRCTGEMFKHLEKQNELLTEIHRSMSHELHKLQVEEEMLMRKFYELMTAHGLTKKNEGSANASDDGEAGNSASLLCLPSNDQQKWGDDGECSVQGGFENKWGLRRQKLQHSCWPVS
ncbi:hypothetical protein AB3S75_028131 [Citrus x aurantiifolia]